MPTIEEQIVEAREGRDAAEQKFRESLRAGRAAGISWSQLATVAGMSMHGVRYLTENLNERRRADRAAAKPKPKRKRK